MKISLKNYTFRYLTFWLLIVIAIWAFIFHSLILDEVYDNVDDGLKNQKIEIIREVYRDPDLLNTTEFGLSQFKISKVDPSQYNESNRFSNEMVYMEYDEDMEPYRVLRTGFYDKDNFPYMLEIRTSTVEEDDLIYDLSISLVALYVFILISILLINHFGLRKAFKPFDQIISQLRKYEVGNKEKPIHVMTNVKEFSFLQNEIQRMINRNDEVFNSQKLFIENASHELQTPLTIAMNKLDLLIEESDLGGKEMLSLVNTKQTLWRMVNLNKSLLMLSRIENNQYKSNEEVNFTSLTKDLLEDYESILEAAEIKVTTNFKADFMIDFNLDLARILISNLIRNAVKHNNEEKLIQIELDSNQFMISNTGKNYSLDTNMIYNRFYKQGTSEGNNGLGLSIVETIIKNQQKLKLNYRYEAPFHQFILKK
ncbi:two-component sensor histidine kinase [Empedobacter brevis NBRC 14943 = ATCC 43319]|uniref:histidine kinase n=1 Tax=Empedobacter brevis NBRC 14943 = ATCC 43319 TaxID=1218108 RepID=A0A511NEV6_9FLAO|nr:HAMP domain-containing sensor histidine kinase [Empedobacter brevis]GEM51126.1 two-component sensor histidine kinase [Empedobacter brevis NBRC 14943 = ATCC 43319]